ncbi:CG32523 [Drosophila busckii]|uniref:trypsin n=1 Tax=Drosophila busckii TaxID=30019 RepID=A0A0M4EIP8_DROBS|nr:serine protease SP24D [Drosophila busckii]ALC48828.1 CG32523 [Drosophila busckii]
MWTQLLLASFACALALAVPTQTELGGRIVGGADAAATQFPHQISLRQMGSHICGGSIIDRNKILTAAHCVTSDGPNGTLLVTPADLLTIRAGSLNRFNGGEVRQVVEVKVHEGYGNLYNDVAVLVLDRPLIYSENIRAIPLASADTPVDSPVIVSGWGRLATEGDVPRWLQWNTLSSLSTRKCTTSTLMNGASLICLAHDAGQGVCFGDSGGPAIYNGEIVGIAGFVIGGCGSKNPDGYAKVFYHRDWIIKHANL